MRPPPSIPAITRMIIFMFGHGGSFNGRGATPNISHLWNSEVTSKANSVLGRDMLVLMRVATSKKKHNEQSPFFIGDTSSKWLFSIAMLVPRKVATQEKDTFELIFVGLTVKVSFFFTKNVVPCFSLVFAKFVQTTCFRMIFLAAKHIANTGVCFLFAGCVVYDEVDQRGLKCSLWCWRPEWKFRFFFSKYPSVQEELLITEVWLFGALKETVQVVYVLLLCIGMNLKGTPSVLVSTEFFATRMNLLCS